MGKKKKAKERLDKYYYMAKEHGYRSRAAFKLIQLNKKFNFLATARNLIDLCAAPGSWLQVATKFMPVNRGTLVGVDLVPIKPIPHVTTFAEDITTQKCRNEIKKAMNNEKADVVLHDGAPNVGTEWSQDAFSQAELALAATKLATEFLAPGGWFVTKVFRSSEYNKLLWVLYQLFTKVVATKPQASRSVSAEIFVVCQGFLAPKKIDPKLLDPKFVFKDIDQAVQQQNIFDADPKKHKRQRMGYEDGVTVLYKEATVDEFVKNGDPITVLGSLNALTFKDERSKRYEKHEATTEEVKACIADLKVLNKKDFKLLLKWRVALRETFADELKAEKAEARALAGSDASGMSDDSDEDGDGALVEIDESAQSTVPLTPEQEEALKQSEMDNRLSELSKKQKKAVKKRRELDAKQRKRMAFQIDIADEFDAPGSTEESLFNLKQLKGPKALTTLDKNDKPELTAEDAEEDEKPPQDDEDEIYFDDPEKYDRMIEENLDQMYSHYLSKKKRRPVELAEEAVKKTKKSKKEKLAAVDDDDEDGDGMQMDEPDETLLMRDPDAPSTSQRTKMWFAQDLFKDVDLGEDDEAAEQLQLKKMLAERAKKRKLDENGSSANTGSESSKPEKKVRFDPDDLDSEDDSDSSDDEDSYESEPVPQYAEEDEEDDSELEDAFDDDDMTVEEKARMMALARKMVGNSKDRSELARSVYNKYPYTRHYLSCFSFSLGYEDSHNIRSDPPLKRGNGVEISV
eukprot:TRINITY_DN1578_c0_g1_i1.p1 TRINITY_DN1578_c0_g1~~TRINITY_DN1578_c0_g1_i1.p1  ORF type:complete len:743 (+),score=274.30 TRINITY_DN1578_c0_g1_i1:181-2409(+)